LISSHDLDVLTSFNGQGNITLSAYLRLDTPQRRESAYSEFMELMQESINDCSPRPECREAIQEDMEIVGLYLKANGHLDQAAIAIFSCAAELFWRVYRLPIPIRTQVAVGPEFDVEPLLRVAGRRKGS
jgi:hypothetical protein